MLRPHRFIRLSSKEDEHLKVLERSRQQPSKLRMRAQILRLSNTGWTIYQLMSCFGRSYAAIRSDFKRYEKEGLTELYDGPAAPGRAPTLTPEILRFIERELEGGWTTWTCPKLSEAIEQKFGVSVGREGIRLKLQKMGYRWRRNRYEHERHLQAEKHPLWAIVKDFEAAMKNNDIDKVLTFFLEDGALQFGTIPKSVRHIGKEKLRLSSVLPGFEAENWNVEVFGEKVKWMSRWSCKMLRDMSVAFAEQTAQVYFEGTKIRLWYVTYNAATAEKIQAAMEHERPR